MRTTLDLDEDVLAGSERARRIPTASPPARCCPTSRGRHSHRPGLCRRSATACRCCRGGPAGAIVTMKLVNELQRRGVSRVALLDVNVLVALFDPDHHAPRSRRTIGSPITTCDGWATCRAHAERLRARFLRIPRHARGHSGRQSCSITCGSSAQQSITSSGPTSVSLTDTKTLQCLR